MSTTSTMAYVAPISSSRRFAIRQPSVAFFIVAFAGSWLMWLPLVLGQNGLGLVPITFPYAVFAPLSTIAGPTLAALLMTAVTGGKAGLRRLLRQYLGWRVAVPWYLLALFGYPLLLLSATSIVLGASPWQIQAQVRPLILSVYLPAILEILIFGQLWEEIGWRGFALPRLLERLGPLVGSLLLGLLSGTWHLPGFFFAAGLAEGRLAMTVPILVATYAQTVFGAMVISLIYTWVFNRTHGSVFIIMLFHTVMNAANRPFLKLVPESLAPQVTMLGSLVLIGLTLLLVIMTRGRLAYRPDRVPEGVEA